MVDVDLTTRSFRCRKMIASYKYYFLFVCFLFDDETYCGILIQESKRLDVL